MATLKVCDVDTLSEGSILQFEIDGREPIAIYRLADGFYATDDLCTHGAAYLSEGDLEGDEIYCPFHAGAFDVRTGEACAAPCVIPLKTYPVTIDGNEVLVDVDG